MYNTSELFKGGEIVKKIKYILFVFVMLMLNSKVTAQTFSCVIDSYYVNYNENGEIESVDLKDESGKLNAVKYIDKYISEFEPKNSNECPTNAITYISGLHETIFYVIKGIEKNLDTNYTCTLEGTNMMVEYTSEGVAYALYSIPKFEKSEVVSNFLPTEPNECPNSGTASLIDGIFYIEATGSNSNKNKTTCVFDEYKIYFEKDGNLIGVYDGNYQKVKKTISSNFHPKNSYECPKDIEISETSNEIRFISNEFSSEDYENYDPNDVKSCGYGSKKIENIPGLIPRTTNIIYTIIQIAIPVVLVLLGSIDLVKGIIAQKEEDIKKGQKMFIKRLIAGAIIFFIFMLIKLFVSLVADNDNDNNAIIDCLECFIENKCD